MIKEAIILAGGLGTRLREVLPDAPKCMAPVAGQPFLTYVIRHLLSQGIQHFIFSLGYKSEVIEEFLKNRFDYLDYICVVEEQPLGTGGAIRLALRECRDEDVMIVNGDTFYRTDIVVLSESHAGKKSECTLALKPMHNFDRYGAVDMNQDARIIRFREKGWVENGNINGGHYILQKDNFLRKEFPAVFSFEKDFLEAYLHSSVFTGVIQDQYFVDIGIPGDYQRAQVELKYPPIPFDRVDQSWTLFLDRDGVINVNKDESYVFNREEFIFMEGALDAIARLSKIFGRIIVITNQRGVGKRLMSMEDLEDIHQFMKQEIRRHGGRIDDVFICTALENKHPDRKPNPGMAFKAKAKFQDIQFSKSIMAGDKSIDMEWGRNIGAGTAWIESEHFRNTMNISDIDLSCASLMKLAQYFQRSK